VVSVITGHPPDPSAAVSFAIPDNSYSRSIPVIAAVPHAGIDKENVQNCADGRNHPWHGVFCQTVKMNCL
jgi:hypothetical protein